MSIFSRGNYKTDFPAELHPSRRRWPNRKRQAATHFIRVAFQKEQQQLKNYMTV